MKRTHKEKELTELQALKKENKELKKQVRSLEHRIRELEKHEHMYEDRVMDEEVAYDSEDTMVMKRIACDECFKGFLDEFQILDKVFGTCTTCGHRKRLK